jgi:Zn finger protein HypA/HybF involved in hydrogenase expression
MIEVSPDTACMLYLSLALAVMIVSWYKSHAKFKKKEIIKYEQIRKTCEFCNHSFLENPELAVPRCPQCHCFLKKENTP